MASAQAATDSVCDKKHVQDEEEARKVHEITESSSDESGDEQAAIESEPDEEKAAEMPAPDVVEKMRSGVYMPDAEEFYNTKNVADMHYLFTNDKLKEEPPALVLRSDPFCIPRVTDNVPNYRPMLNPLSIFLGEDKLLPGNFRLDPSEQLPSAEEKDGKKAPPRRILQPPGSSASSTSSGKQFRGKTSAFMGTLPRQTEFAEIPVSEKLFQNHEVFRPSPPVPRVPVSPRPAPGVSRPFPTAASEAEQASTLSALGTTPAVSAGTATASYSDAMLLSSIQHTLDVTTAALSSADSPTPALDSGVTNSAPSATSPVSSGYQIQQLHPLESVAHTLSNYLPSRGTPTPDGSRPMDNSYYTAPGGYNAVNAPMGYAPPGTFGSLLAPGSQAGVPYAGLFEGTGEASQSMQTFSSALGSISITTPTGAAGIHSGLMTPQGGAVRPSEGAPRRPAKKPRAKNVFRPCTSPGCTKGARGKSGLCQKHGGGKRCAAPNCPKGAQGSSSMCLFHGGGYRCTVEGCTTGARGTSGLCAKHGGYKKGKRGPDVSGPASKRVRTDDPQPAAAAVKAE